MCAEKGDVPNVPRPMRDMGSCVWMHVAATRTTPVVAGTDTFAAVAFTRVTFKYNSPGLIWIAARTKCSPLGPANVFKPIIQCAQLISNHSSGRRRRTYIRLATTVVSKGDNLISITNI